MDKPAPQTDQTTIHENDLEYGRHLVISYNCDFTFQYTLAT